MKPTFYECSVPKPQQLFEVGDILKIAFKNDGFVAGGFAHVVMRNAFLGDELHENVHRYLGSQTLHKKPQFNSNMGDVDIFFETPNGFDETLNAIENLCAQSPDRFQRLQSHPGAFVEFAVGTLLAHKVQLIQRNFIPMVHQLMSFDIYNGMVGFNKDYALVPEGWYDLVQAKALHVHNWTTSPLIFNRITKWFRKHGYNKLSSKTASEAGDAALACINFLKDQPWFPSWADKKMHKPLSVSDVMHHIHTLVPNVSNEQLLLLMTLFPPGNVTTYDEWRDPFSVLRKRTA